MKKYMAVWGALFFCVVCLSLYLMLETLNTSPGRYTDIDAKFSCRILQARSLPLERKPLLASGSRFPLQKRSWKQGWNVTYPAAKWNQGNKLRVFVVPHSHNDPGWVKTYDKYYTEQVRHILNNMLEKLEQHPKMKFMYAEISFFHIWWNELDESKKNRVRRLFEDGRLEIVTGGWVMNDEANTHYFAMLDQLLEGHQWLDGTLGVKPSSGWAIDPFGHTPTMAYLLRRSGFNSMLIQRVHYALKKHLAKNKQLEFMARLIIDQWKKKGSLYKSNSVFAPLGDDFRYDKADEWDLQYVNYQKIFDYLQQHPELGAQFGTLSDYFKSIYEESKVKPGEKPTDFPTLVGDFFTYADKDDHYWSGYFTSRPFQKNLDRVMESHLRAAEIIFSMALTVSRQQKALNNFPATVMMDRLIQARRNLGLFQHHDGITGTAKDFVASEVAGGYETCDQGLCHISESRRQGKLPDGLVLLYNSLAHERDQVVSIHVSSPHVMVQDENNKPVLAQVAPVWEKDDIIAENVYKVSFRVTIPGLAISKYMVKRVAETSNSNTIPPLPDHTPPVIHVVKGPVVSEVQVYFNLVTHVVRLYNSSGVDGISLDIQNIVDIQSQRNMEVAVRITTDVENAEREFYTDLNGFHSPTNPLAFPSLLAHHTSLQLIHPVFTIPANTGHHSKYPQFSAFSPLATQLPCDTHMVNLRTNQNADDGKDRLVPKHSAALFLHRLGYDCNFVVLSNMFRNMQITVAQQVSLTLMYHEADLDTTGSIDLDPMEIGSDRNT
ncbi:MA2A2-like protein [Mya arenaria]|uniref:Alpha-mannosidase n=1 Tax=Mya arenaria TaxID=6604 RepID=A0ABY7G622_MYAAR|nr:MA2A2-like protein [Mya arenaria]